ncbi:MAG: helix-hairpin-helix domain-containing protein [Candidatus Omnitrophota bacterium]|nr:helix-hairpin-helix domain-containing protein [Candidatus Omnitrophota bacterium]
MFDLKNSEKSVLIFLLATLLIGLSIGIHKKHDKKIIDVKIRSFDYEPSRDVSLKININEADEESLTRLDGIGPSLACKILAYRSERGSFGSVEELKKVKGLGEKLFEKIKDEVSVE